MRGLKHQNQNGSDRTTDVARSTRAWIETESGAKTERKSMSHALRVRGLKPGLVVLIVRSAVVARSTRAWIETF